jgi:hypothetical protein
VTCARQISPAVCRKPLDLDVVATLSAAAGGGRPKRRHWWGPPRCYHEVMCARRISPAVYHKPLDLDVVAGLSAAAGGGRLERHRGLLLSVKERVGQPLERGRGRHRLDLGGEGWH